MLAMLHKNSDSERKQGTHPRRCLALPDSRDRFRAFLCILEAFHGWQPLSRHRPGHNLRLQCSHPVLFLFQLHELGFVMFSHQRV